MAKLLAFITAVRKIWAQVRGDFANPLDARIRRAHEARKAQLAK